MGLYLYSIFIREKWVANNKNINTKKLILIFLFVFFLIISLPCLLVTFFKILFGSYIDSQIRLIVEKETSGASFPEEKIQKLSNWFNDNIQYAEKNDTIFNILRFSICGIPEEITFFLKRGRCSEWASLYLKLLNYSNISGRIIIFVEDHAFVEARINNTWIPVEPPFGVMSFEYYKSTRNVSKAYAKENYRFIDVTRNYSDTGILFVRVLDDNNKTVSRANICIFSKYLMLAHPTQYKTHKLSTCNVTDDYSTYKEELGKGIYDIWIWKFDFPYKCLFAEINNYIVSFNKTNEISVTLANKNLLFCLYKILHLYIFE
jgi:hypothetical protein